jgi:1-hydroxycarotenoid 3,4-desaturase
MRGFSQVVPDNAYEMFETVTDDESGITLTIRVLYEPETGKRFASMESLYGYSAALTKGLLGDAAQSALPAGAAGPPSLSALVWAFAATPQGPCAADLIHHNLFFTDDPAREFGPIGKGQMPDAPTLYLCAEDRARGPAPAGTLERFEIILNAPAGLPARPEDFTRCRHMTFDHLSSMGLTFSPLPDPQALTTPAALDRLFPASQGAIYGRSPEGTMAAFQRPPARTALPGLYLAGGGAHPGAGVPMAALSCQHAAEAIRQARTSALKSAPTAMPGGMSMGSARTGRAPSR